LVNNPNSQILEKTSIWVKSHYLGYSKNSNFTPNFYLLQKHPLSSIVVVCAVIHNILYKHQSSDEIFSEYESADMVVDENDKQSAQGNKVMCFVYFTMYGMMLVALTPNYHIALVQTLLVICCNKDSINL